MEIEKVFCFSSPVGKVSDELWKKYIKHTEIQEDHDVFNKMVQLVADVKKDCNLNIKFTSTDGKQDNEVRNMIINIVKSKDANTIRPLVERLSSKTDNKSKSGLVFIIIGNINKNTFIIIARFPAEEGIVVNDKDKKIKVEIIDEVFLKNSHRYKLVYFEGKSVQGDFWKGLALDKQINESVNYIREISDYWIYDFLQCELEMTSKRGSTLLAKTFRSALNSDLPDSDKEDLIKLSLGIKQFDGKKTSIKTILKKVNMSEAIQEKIIKSLPNREVADTIFDFSSIHFNGIFNLRVKYLDTGAIIIGPNDVFDNLFNPLLVADSGITRYTTEGITTNETVRSKI